MHERAGGYVRFFEGATREEAVAAARERGRRELDSVHVVRRLDNPPWEPESGPAAVVTRCPTCSAYIAAGL